MTVGFRRGRHGEAASFFGSVFVVRADANRCVCLSRYSEEQRAWQQSHQQLRALSEQVAGALAGEAEAEDRVEELQLRLNESEAEVARLTRRLQQREEPEECEEQQGGHVSKGVDDMRRELEAEREKSAVVQKALRRMQKSVRKIEQTNKELRENVAKENERRAEKYEALEAKYKHLAAEKEALAAKVLAMGEVA